MTSDNQVLLFWFRRDLRIEDNVGLSAALESGMPVQPIFIFDNNITDDLPGNDSRITFIYDLLHGLNTELIEFGSSIKIYKGDPYFVFEKLFASKTIGGVFLNEDYEPYAIKRDRKVSELAQAQNVRYESFKDQVVFAKNEILKPDNKPYTVYTPFKNKWLEKFDQLGLPEHKNPNVSNLVSGKAEFPTLEELGFSRSGITVPDFSIEVESTYASIRDIPAAAGTTYLSTHLRFGSVSIRKIFRQLKDSHGVLASELIWREFFSQILYHFPKVIHESFKKQYDGIDWLNNEDDFEKWCEGKTGYPIVDAGMQELNSTGLMHNRVRMITASFLCKHLLIDWRWGESYFASKLLDFDIASNNGNWQWVAGTGCDAAPYFRIFNPITQQQKFDPDFAYIKKWVPEFGSKEYIEPMVDHKLARTRALEVYKVGIS